LVFHMISNQRFRSTALVVTLGIGLVAPVLCSVVVIESRRQRRAAKERVNQTVEVLSAATTLDTDLAIVIGEGRGFVISKGALNITPFDAAATKVANDNLNMRVLTSDNPVRQVTLDRIEPLSVARLALLREFNERLQAGGADNVSRIVGISRDNTSLMEQIFVSADELKAEERHLLGARQSTAWDAARLLVNPLIGCGVLIAAIGFFITLLLMGVACVSGGLDATNAALERLARHLVREQITKRGQPCFLMLS
jgi:CHASE3 domain sensor protein